jgi:hypothetical protein
VTALKDNQGILNGEAEKFFQQAMDVTRDKSGCDFMSAIENFSLVKKMALGLLKADASEKLSVPDKRKLAGWSPENLLNILEVK